MRLRLFCAIFIPVALAAPAHSEDEGGWNFSGRFSGSSNSAGVILKADPSIGYIFNSHFRTYAGVPVYFTQQSSTLDCPPCCGDPDNREPGICDSS